MWNTLSNAGPEKACSNHSLLILREVRPQCLPSNEMVRVFFKLLLSGCPGAYLLDTSIQLGFVWICVWTGMLDAQGRRHTVWLGGGGGGEAMWGKGPEEFCYCEEKRLVLVQGLFSGGRRSYLRMVPPHSDSTFLSACLLSLPLTRWTASSLRVVASIVTSMVAEAVRSSCLLFSTQVLLLPSLKPHYTSLFYDWAWESNFFFLFSFFSLSFFFAVSWEKYTEFLKSIFFCINFSFFSPLLTSSFYWSLKKE